MVYSPPSLKSKIGQNNPKTRPSLNSEIGSYDLAEKIAEEIVKRGFGIITGGGPGIMERANKGAQQAKGRSCGVCIKLPNEPRPNPYIDPRHELNFRYFFVRKVMFVRYAQAFVVILEGDARLA